jgi:hypothetical protein
MPFTKLVVAGASGILADAILPALINSTSPKFDITVLTRSNSGKSPSLPGAKVVAVDYDNHASLVKAVTGADAIVSLLASGPGKAIDLKLLKAAQDAKVRRIFPSEYTVDVLFPEQAKLMTEGGQWDDSTSPVVTARKFAALAEQDGPTSYTTIMSSGFIDLWLQGRFGLFEPQNHKVSVIDSDKHHFTGSSLSFIAASLIAILQMDEEKTKNKRIPIAEVRATMAEVIGAYEEAAGVKFETTTVPSQGMLQMRDQSLEKGDTLTAMFVAVQLGAFNGSGAGDLVEGLRFDGDGYLTAKRQTLKELVTEAVTVVNSS